MGSFTGMYNDVLGQKLSSVISWGVGEMSLFKTYSY